MPTAGDDAVAKRLDQATDFLAQADREFDAGDRYQGSENLYGAATRAVIAAVKQCGWQYIAAIPPSKRGRPAGIGIPGSIADCRISRRRKVPQELLSR